LPECFQFWNRSADWKALHWTIGGVQAHFPAGWSVEGNVLGIHRDGDGLAVAREQLDRLFGDFQPRPRGLNLNQCAAAPRVHYL